jgi:hypothetical protein
MAGQTILTCPECEQAGHTKEFKGPRASQIRGIHRRFQHGVQGPNSHADRPRTQMKTRATKPLPRPVRHARRTKPEPQVPEAKVHVRRSAMRRPAVRRQNDPGEVERLQMALLGARGIVERCEKELKRLHAPLVAPLITTAAAPGTDKPGWSAARRRRQSVLLRAIWQNKKGRR